jgi:hypothetical protein
VVFDFTVPPRFSKGLCLDGWNGAQDSGLQTAFVNLNQFVWRSSDP